MVYECLVVYFRLHYEPQRPIYQYQALSALFAVKNIHPTDSLCVTDFSQVDLRGFQILMPQDYFRHHFKRHTISTGIGG